VIKEREYANAGVPMMPVVKGSHETKAQMLVYTLLLPPLTILPTLAGTKGILYPAAAVLLGSRLLWYCLRFLRESSPTPLAWNMYRYSLLYLPLLFCAMGIDKQTPLRPPGSSALGHHPQVGRISSRCGSAGVTIGPFPSGAQ